MRACKTNNQNQQTNKILKKTFCCLLSTAFFASAALTAPAYAAADTGSLQQQMADLQQKINQANADIEALGEQKAATEEYLGTLSAKMDMTQKQIGLLEAEVARIQGEVDKLQTQITEKEMAIATLELQIADQQKQFQVKKEQYNQRLRVLYTSGSVTNLEALLTSDDISVLLTRAQLINSVSKKDQGALEELTGAMKEIKAKQRELESSKKKLEESKVTLLTSKSAQDDALAAAEKQKAALEADKKKNQKAAEDYQTQIMGQTGFIKTTKNEQDTIDRQIQDEIRQAEEDLLNNNGGNSGGGTTEGGSSGSGNTDGGGTTEGGSSGGGNTGGGNTDGGGSGGFDYSYIGTGVYKGRFVHPAPARNYISVGFPYYKDGDWHGGVDFACGNAFPDIYAADTGTVLISKDLGGASYGRYIVIRHENGLYTLYGHCEKLYVQKGDTVNRGQVIAKVGSTGNSSGNHLHFEVRLGQAESNRNVDNPSKYINDSLFWF